MMRLKMKNKFIQLSLLFILQGMTTMTNATVDTSDDFPIKFESNCVGRYQIELPADLVRVSSSYADENIDIESYRKDKNTLTQRVYRGKNRTQNWLNFVEQEQKRDRGATLLEKEVNAPLKYKTYYQNLMNRYHAYNAYIFKDFPEKEIGVAIKYSGKKNFKIEESDHRAQFHQELTKALNRTNEIQYLPWPHKMKGICLDNEFTIVKNGKKVAQEHFSASFANNKGSHIDIMIHKFRGDEKALQETIKESLIFKPHVANSNLKVMGREGVLLVSGHEYSKTARSFVWVATDTKPYSIPYAAIEIEGTIEMENYPEMSPINGVDMLYGLLKFMKVRANGMLDTE